MKRLFFIDDPAQQPPVNITWPWQKPSMTATVSPDEDTIPEFLNWTPWDEPTPKACTCGADKTYGVNNRSHVDWRDKK